MLGSKKTVPLWRRSKAKFLEQGRALKSETKKDRSDSERSVIERTIERERLEREKAASEAARHRL